ncbi:MAG: glycosyltransferase family 2 protein [Blastocatellia bacterium]
MADSLMRFVLLCLRTFKRKRALPPPDEPLANLSNGAVLLIAAHNEAGTIGATAAALGAQLNEWPGSRLWVVADRCHDATAQEAALAGAQVADRKEGRLGKCAVISWWLEQHPVEWRSRDAVVVLDADSRLKDGSLRELRRAMSDPRVAVAQSFVAPDAESRSGRLAGWSEVLMQRIDDEARRRCGWSAPLRGTGMTFRGELLAELAPRLHTLAEDLELDVMLAARSRRVAFVPDAVVIDPKPRQAAGASRQRARWLQGQLQVIAGYPRELGLALIQAPCRGEWGAWLLLPLLLLRPKILFIGLRFAALLLASLRGFALTGLALDLIYYLAGAAFVDRPRQYLRDLIATPRYAAMWTYSLSIATFQRIFRRDHRVWLRAGR